MLTVLGGLQFLLILLAVLCGLKFLIRKFPFCGCRSNMYFHFLLQILWIYSRLCLIKSPPPYYQAKRPRLRMHVSAGPTAPYSWTTAAQCNTKLHYSCTVLHTALLQLHHSCSMLHHSFTKLRNLCTTTVPRRHAQLHLSYTTAAVQLHLNPLRLLCPKAVLYCSWTSIYTLGLYIAVPSCTTAALHPYSGFMHCYLIATLQMLYSCTTHNCSIAAQPLYQATP